MDLRGGLRERLGRVRVYKPDVIIGETAEPHIKSTGRRVGALGRAAIGAGAGSLLWLGISWGSGELFPGGHNEMVRTCSATMGPKMKFVKALPAQCADESLGQYITLIQPDATATTALVDAAPGAAYVLPPKEVFTANAEEHTDYGELPWMLGAGALVGAALPYAGQTVGRVRERLHR